MGMTTLDASKLRKRVRPAKESSNSTIVLPSITQLNTDIHAYLVHIHTRYDATSFFWSAFIEVRKNGGKCPLRRAWVEFLWCGVLPAPPIGGLLVVFLCINIVERCAD